MKHTARHFVDKLGNSLYQGNFRLEAGHNTFPKALEQYDHQRNHQGTRIFFARRLQRRTTTPAATEP